MMGENHMQPFTINSGGESVTDRHSGDAGLRERSRELERNIATIKRALEGNRSDGFEMLDALLTSVDDHVTLVDKDFNILWANRSVKQRFGRNLIGGKCYNACHSRQDLCGTKPCIIRKTFQDGQSHAHDSQVSGPDGTKIYFNSVSNVVLSDKDGTPTAVVKVSKDVTDYQHALEELHHSMELLRKNLSGTIQAIAMTVETRDAYTAGHQKRTTNLARAIAQELGLPKDRVDAIRMAGVIHDLGKISVPAEILSKPGSITDIEFSLIKNHPRTGYDILKGIEFQWPIADIVLQHHERLDGSGYPQGLQGNDILLEARIIGVADVIEAMASHRPYRPALGMEEAFNEITDHRGSRYDVDVVDASLHLLHDKGFLIQ